MNGPVNIVQPGLINQTFQSTYLLSKQNAKWQNECNSFANFAKLLHETKAEKQIQNI